MSDIARKIALEVYIGLAMQEHFGEAIRDYYRKGKSMKEICDVLCLKSVYEVKDSIANRALGFALNGYNPSRDYMHLPQYNGLLAKGEMRVLAREHKISAGKKMKTNEVGIHGLSYQGLAEAGSKGGKKQYEEKIGIHVQSHKQRVEAGRLSAERRGQIPWTGEERNNAIKLKRTHNYHEVAEILNLLHHNGKVVRKEKSARLAVWKAGKNID